MPGVSATCLENTYTEASARTASEHAAVGVCSMCAGMPLQVRELYRLVKYEPKNAKTESYVDAWNLRRLYTFSFRRQLDAAKRDQNPRDRCFLFCTAGSCMFCS